MPPKRDTRLLNQARAQENARRYGDVGFVHARPLISCEFEDVYTLQQVLSSGSFAKIYSAVHKETQAEYAVKVLQIAEADSALRKAWLAQEVEITRRVAHRNIVTLHEVVRTETAYYLVFDKMQSDLWEYLRDLRKQRYWVSWGVSICWMRSLLDVIAYLHSHDIVHRDIKPENLLVSQQKTEIYLTDFGIAKVIDNRCTPFGSRSYMAPEIISCVARSGAEMEKVLMTKESVKGLDMWSFGVVFYFLLMGVFPEAYGKQKEDLVPHAADSQVWRALIFPESPRSQQRWAQATRGVGAEESENVRDLIVAILSLDPLSRPTAADALKSPAFKTAELRPQLSSAAEEQDDGAEVDIAELKEYVNQHIEAMRRHEDE